MSLIRRSATNIIRTFDPESGIADARRNATYEPKYLRGLLGKVFINFFSQNAVGDSGVEWTLHKMHVKFCIYK